MQDVTGSILESTRLFLETGTFVPYQTGAFVHRFCLAAMV